MKVKMIMACKKRRGFENYEEDDFNDESSQYKD